MATRSSTKTKPKPAQKSATGKTSGSKTATKTASPKPRSATRVEAKPTKTPLPEMGRVTRVEPKPKAKTETVGELAPDAVVVQGDLTRRELLEEVSQRVDLPKNKVKPILESFLEVMGETVAEGRAMKLQPLGRIVRKRHKDLPGAKISILRIRQNKTVT